MSWMFDHENFILKGYGVYDLKSLISAMVEAGSPQEAVGLALPGHYDIRSSELTGVEIDAVELAFKNGRIDLEVYEAIHNGPEDENYEAAFKMALKEGAGLVNRAIEEQNNLNTRAADRGYQKMPEAFSMGGIGGEVKVNPAWEQGAGAELGQVRQGKSVDPFLNGRLVTHIISTMTKKEEGWSRPYEEALQMKGLEEKKRNDRMIRGHKDFSNRNLVSINDIGQLTPMWNSLQAHYAQGASQVNHEEALDYAEQEWLQEPASFHMTGSQHHALESSYNRVNRKDDGQLPLGDVEIEGEEAAQTGMPPGHAPAPRGNPLAVIHPDHRETKWLKNMTSNTGHYLYNLDSEKPNKNVLDYLTQYHNLDEGSASQLMRDARTDTAREGGVKKRFLDAVLNHHVQTTSNVPDWFDDDIPPSVAPLLTTEGAMRPQEALLEEPPLRVATDPPPIPSPKADPPERDIAGESILTPTPAVIPRVLPRAIEPYPTPPSGIKTNIPSGGASQQGGGWRGLPTQIAELLGRLSAGGTILRSEDSSMLEAYLENVQLELAKATIEDNGTVVSFDLDSPTDIAMMSSHIQRPTADVVSILHTKGDWRHIAKSFGIEHKKVQMVKVAFHG